MFFFKKKKKPQPPLYPGIVPFDGSINPLVEAGCMLPSIPEPIAALEMAPIFQRPDNVPLVLCFTSIGRSSACNIMIPMPNAPGSSIDVYKLVSQKHCTLRCAVGTVCIQDNGSTHGTYLNGVRLPHGIWTDVPDNAEVCLGHPEIKFIVHYTSAEQSDPSGTDDGFVRVDP